MYCHHKFYLKKRFTFPNTIPHNSFYGLGNANRKDSTITILPALIFDGKLDGVCMHYYQFNVADYRKDTAHLTPIEHYIYRTLIDLYYLDEKPIPKETQWVLRRLCLASEYEPQLQNVLKDFFIECKDEWKHKRVEDEIYTFHKNCEKNRANGKLGGRPLKTQSVILANPTKTEPKAKKSLTNNHKPKTNNHINTPDGVALALWSDFLVLRKAKNLPITQTALDGIQREAEKAGLTMAQAIQTCCERGWGGFKADWLKAEAVAQEKQDQAWRFDDGLMLKKAKELNIHAAGKTRQELIAAIDKKRGVV